MSYDAMVPTQLTTIDDVAEWLDSSWHTVWAKVAGRDDVEIVELSGVRSALDDLEVNAGTVIAAQEKTNWRPRYDWNFPEWLPALRIYVKHNCEGCTYPPNMCCLQGYGDDD